MRLLKFIIPFVLLHVITLTAQPYLNETSRWKQNFLPPSGPEGWTYFDDEMIQLDGDTAVNGRTYFRVLKTGTSYSYYHDYWNDTTYTYQKPIHKYMAPIREE